MNIRSTALLILGLLVATGFFLTGGALGKMHSNKKRLRDIERYKSRLDQRKQELVWLETYVDSLKKDSKVFFDAYRKTAARYDSLVLQYEKKVSILEDSLKEYPKLDKEKYEEYYNNL